MTAPGGGRMGPRRASGRCARNLSLSGPASLPGVHEILITSTWNNCGPKVLIRYSSISKAFEANTTASKYTGRTQDMTRFTQAIRRHRETTRQERELNRALRSASGSDMRSELVFLANAGR